MCIEKLFMADLNNTREQRPKTMAVREADLQTKAWRGFKPSKWEHGIDVKHFIDVNITTYSGTTPSWPDRQRHGSNIQYRCNWQK